MTVSQDKTKPQAHRYRLSVPPADESVVTWMELQDNASLSMRLLIRESIERNGYVDVMNKPVAQLPKRGRPAGSEDLGEGLPPAAAPVPVPAPRQAQPVTPSVPAARAPQDEPKPVQPGIAQAAPAPVPDHGSRQTPAVDSFPAPSNPEQPSSGPMEVNDIFSTLR